MDEGDLSAYRVSFIRLPLEPTVFFKLQRPHEIVSTQQTRITRPSTRYVSASVAEFVPIMRVNPSLKMSISSSATYCPFLFEFRVGCPRFGPP